MKVYSYKEAQKISNEIIKTNIFNVDDIVIFKDIPRNNLPHILHRKNKLFKIVKIYYEHSGFGEHAGHIRITHADSNKDDTLNVFAFRLEHYIPTDILDF